MKTGENMDDYLRVGVIANTHGLKGEVKVFPTTDDVSRFEYLKQVYVDTGKGYEELVCTGCKYFKNLVILKFKGVNDINEVEKYKGKDLYVTRENAVPLEEGEFFITDLIDLKVIDEENKEIGILYDVMQTGANDVYVIKLTDSGKEILLPVIDECILDINPDEGFVKVHILEGLMD